jgi:hypothetical protein
MFYRGLSNWPPVWVWIDGGENRYPRGDLGVLQEVRGPNIGASNRLFLVMDYLGSAYMGCLLFDDEGFCRDIHKLLIGHCGMAIDDIGRLDVRRLL